MIGCMTIFCQNQVALFDKDNPVKVSNLIDVTICVKLSQGYRFSGPVFRILCR